MIAASGRSGRYERYFALMILAAQIPFGLTTAALRGAPEVAATVLLDVSTAFGAAWLLSRRREAWLMLELAIQVAAVPTSGLLHLLTGPGVGPTPLLWGLYLAAGALSYLQLAVLVFAVLRREFGPPYPLPRSEAAAAAA